MRAQLPHLNEKIGGRLSGVQHRFRPWFIVWILVMWCLLMGELTVANVVGGVLVGLAVTYLLPLPAMPVGGLDISWGLLFRFIGVWLWDFVVASLKVAWLAIRPADPPRTAILTAPMRVDNEFVLALAVFLYNLQPGGTVTDIDSAGRMLTVHIFAADNKPDIERALGSIGKLERAMIAIFERSV